MIKGGVLHYFSKKATVVVSLSSHLFGPENNCSLPLKCPAIHPRAKENKEKSVHTKNLVLSISLSSKKNSFRWEVQGKWKLNVLINKALLHVDRYFIRYYFYREIKRILLQTLWKQYTVIYFAQV